MFIININSRIKKNTALANEEKDLAKDQRQAIIELRERITQETKSATEDQEKKIGLIIARLQVLINNQYMHCSFYMYCIWCLHYSSK